MPKLVTFALGTPLGPVRRLGVLIDGREDGRIADLNGAYADYLARDTDEALPREIAMVRTPPDMIGWLRGGRQSRRALDEALAHLGRRAAADPAPRGLAGEQLIFERREVRLLAPLPRPNSIRDFSIYEEHMTRSGRAWAVKPPAWYVTPPYYKGNPDAVFGPEDPIPFPYHTEKLDLEPEIGIVIGRSGRNLTIEEAGDHIAGYTIFIDASCRDGHDRETLGPTKRKDFCNVLGPCLVTADDLDEGNLAVRVEVDGETWFEGNTGHLRAFEPRHLVAYASDNETLHPGDVIGTGTVGLGCSMDLHRWIKVGQTASIEVQGIGRLTHRIVAGERVVSHVFGMPGLLKHKPA